MGPLSMTHPLVNNEEQFNRSTEHLIIARESSEPPGAVGPGYPKKGVHVLAQLVAARPIRLPEVRRVHWALGALVRAFRGVDSPREFDDGCALGAGHCDDFPWL